MGRLGVNTMFIVATMGSITPSNLCNFFIVFSYQKFIS
jgi:hypothetical protein